MTKRDFIDLSLLVVKEESGNMGVYNTDNISIELKEELLIKVLRRIVGEIIIQITDKLGKTNIEYRISFLYALIRTYLEKSMSEEDSSDIVDKIFNSISIII